MRGSLMLLALAGLAAWPSNAWCQQPTDAAAGSPTFEVASVKRNTSGTATVSVGPRPGGYEATNVPLRLLVELAFGVRPSQIVGGPGWMLSERFDVAARAPEGAAPSIIPAMLRTLLRDRFKLRARSEIREQPIYALIPSRVDGRLGPQLKPSTVECTPPGRTPNPCRLSGTIGAAAGSVKGTGQTLGQLATFLTRNVDRPVVDQTEISAPFDFEFSWTADDLRAAAADAGTLPARERAGLFTALRESLGLKLEATRGPVEFVVIDSVEPPAPD
jgi:uncharacterized protein (TIGR03435 family)